VERFEEDTLPKILLKRATGPQRERIAIREKDYGIWQSYSWGAYLDNVKRFALGLASLGFKRGDKLSVIGDNRPQGYWAQVAALCLGGIPVPLYQDAIEKELEYIIEHSGARFVVAEDQEQVDKMLALKDKIPTMEMIIYDDPRGLRNYNQPYIKSFTHVQELGVEFEKKPEGCCPDIFEPDHKREDTISGRRILRYRSANGIPSNGMDRGFHLFNSHVLQHRLDNKLP